MILQQLQHGFAAPQALRRNQYATAVLADVALQLVQRLLGAPFDIQIRQAGGDSLGAEINARQFMRLAKKIVGLDQQQLGFEYRAFRVIRQQAIA